MKLKLQLAGSALNTNVGLTINDPVILVHFRNLENNPDDTVTVYAELHYHTSEASYAAGDADLGYILTGVPVDWIKTYTANEFNNLNAAAGTFTAILNDVLVYLQPTFGVGNISIIT